MRGPGTLSIAAGTALLVLTDPSTRLPPGRSRRRASVRDWVAFHIGAPLVTAEEADFAVGTWEALAPVSRFKIGLPDYPDRSATLIVECDRLVNHGPCLTGPGIETATWLNLPETTAFRATGRCSPGLRHAFHCRRPDRRSSPVHPRGGKLMYVAVKGGEAPSTMRTSGWPRNAGATLRCPS